MEDSMLLHLLCLLLTTIVSTVGGACKSKTARSISKNSSPNDAKNLCDIEEGRGNRLAAAESYSSIGELDLSDNLDDDLSDSRVNYWDEDHTDGRQSEREEAHLVEEESEEDYTEDAELDRVREEECLPDEMDPGDVGIMKKLKRVSSDCYLTRQHTGVDCDSPEAAQEAKLKLKEMWDSLPFRPLLILKEEHITYQNFKAVFEKMGSVRHQEQREEAVSRKDRQRLQEEMETTYKPRHVKLKERAPVYLIYLSDPVRNIRVDNDEETVDCSSGEEQQ